MHFRLNFFAPDMFQVQLPPMQQMKIDGGNIEREKKKKIKAKTSSKQKRP